VPDPFFAALMAGADAPELGELLDRPAWQSDALCREYDDVLAAIDTRAVSTATVASACDGRALRCSLFRARMLWWETGWETCWLPWLGVSPRAASRTSRYAGCTS
jgi:hypothetical protein